MPVGLPDRRRRGPPQGADTRGYNWLDAPADLARAFGRAGKAGLTGYATALTGVDDEGRTVGNMLPVARDERTGDVSLAAPRILDLWNTVGGAVPARGITLGAGPVVRRGAKAADQALDMSQEARMARARAMGFDVDRPVYHGTASEFSEFRPSSGGEFGPGVYFTTSPNEASAYTATNRGASGAGENIIPAFLRSKKPFVVQSSPDEFWKRFGGATDDEAIANAIAEGFDPIQFNRPVQRWVDGQGIVDTGEMQTHIVALDPRNIRSTQAAFDPARADSADLLAARAAPGAAASTVINEAGDALRGSDLPDTIARLLREGRASEVTDEMLSALTPSQNRRLVELYESGATGMDMPMDEASRMARAREMGMSHDVYHGRRQDFSKFEKTESLPARGSLPAMTSNGFYFTPDTRYPFISRQIDAEGWNVTPARLRMESPEITDRIGTIEGMNVYADAPEYIEQLKAKGRDAVVYADPSDLTKGASGWGDDYAQYFTFDPRNIRSRHARFDPRLRNNADLLAARAAPGAGIGLGDPNRRRRLTYRDIEGML